MENVIESVTLSVAFVHFWNIVINNLKKNCDIYAYMAELLYLSVSVPLKKNASATVSHFTSY